ncbi:hypothetical protein BJY59DRAFT_723183 [Rhodotorula toruloides]
MAITSHESGEGVVEPAQGAVAREDPHDPARLCDRLARRRRRRAGHQRLDLGRLVRHGPGATSASPRLARPTRPPARRRAHRGWNRRGGSGVALFALFASGAGEEAHGGEDEGGSGRRRWFGGGG